jgi:regulator of replication initiation timing
MPLTEGLEPTPVKVNCVGTGAAETLRAVLCLEDIDAAGTEAVLENQRLRTENSALKQRLYYLKQLLDEGEEPHG